MFGEKPRLIYPVVPYIESEAATRAEAGGGEEVAAGVACAVQDRPPCEPFGVNLFDKAREGGLRLDHAGRTEFGWVGARRCGFTGADAGSDLDIMVPRAEPNDLVT
jgi:hypothetical protein